MEKIDVKGKCDSIEGYWNPKIMGAVNDSYVKLAKFKGEFMWHTHDNEDEMFYVLKGEITLRFRDRDVVLGENESMIIPRGVEHMPMAEEEAHVMMVEAKSTVNTGNVVNDKTIEVLDEI